MCVCAHTSLAHELYSNNVFSPYRRCSLSFMNSIPTTQHKGVVVYHLITSEAQ